MEKKEMQGIFFESLKRNNKQIRDDRAQAIAEDTEMAYKRQVEDLAIKIKRLSRQREGMLDLSPTDAMSLKLANDFDAQEFVEKELNLGCDIRNLVIQHNIAVNRYNILFGADLEELKEEGGV